MKKLHNALLSIQNTGIIVILHRYVSGMYISVPDSDPTKRFRSLRIRFRILYTVHWLPAGGHMKLVSGQNNSDCEAL
jgi:hypothetical protein